MKHVGALLLGGVVALSTVAVHRLDALGLPIGLVLGVLATVAAAWHLRRSDTPRTTASFCLGWVAVLGGALAGRPEGDFALTSDLPGYTLMGVGFLLVAFGVTSLGARTAAPPTYTLSGESRARPLQDQ